MTSTNDKTLYSVYDEETKQTIEIWAYTLPEVIEIAFSDKVEQEFKDKKRNIRNN